MVSSQNIVSIGRKKILIYFCIFIVLILLIKLYQLQIIRYSQFAGFAEANRVRVIPIEAPRGIIYDRSGEIIAENIFQYNLNIIPYEFGASDSGYSWLANLLRISQGELKLRVQKNWRGRFLPVKVGEDIDFETLSVIEEHRLDMPGVLYSLEPIRSFPSPANLAQVLGYLREVDREVLKNIRHFGYRTGDLIGWKGIERQYEYILRGTRGYDYLQVDVFGREVGALDNKKDILPKPGNDLYLTIDLEFQAYAESLLDGKSGVIIALNADNGEIYSMVSKPDYSPNLFSGIVESKVWAKLRDNPDLPLYNRATMGTYPPGSTFKINAAMTALQNHTVDEDWSVHCSGSYRLGRRPFKCWKETGHGKMNLHSAIVNSCNVFFYQLIRKMDIDLWAENARRFRFGEKTQIDLPIESVGSVPDRKFLDSKYGVNGWTEGNKLNLVIGQGDLLVTPIQMARFAAALASKGKIVQPHLGLKYFNKDNNQFTTFTTKTDSLGYYSPENWAFVQNAMYDVVNFYQGTAKSARVKDMRVYGKTGTAENPRGDAHAWFIGFCETEVHPIAVVVLVEHGGSGGTFAAPIAGKLFTYIKEKGLK